MCQPEPDVQSNSQIYAVFGLTKDTQEVRKLQKLDGGIQNCNFGLLFYLPSLRQTAKKSRQPLYLSGW